MGIDIIALFVAIPIAILAVTSVYFVRSSAIEREPPEATDETSSIWQRPRVVGYWASAIAMSLVYILAGFPKIGEFTDVLHRFAGWGYSEEFLMFIGASEVVAGIFLLIPQTARYAATYLSVIMVGAIYTHLAFDTFIWALLPFFCLSFLVFIAYEANERHKSDAKAVAAGSA